MSNKIELGEFIAKAKRNTYASGKKARILEDGFEEFLYEEGNYKYRDKYYARDPNSFGGEEFVWLDNNVVWMMNYYGFILTHKEESEKIYSFLRKAMSLVGKMTPFRGPKHFIEGEFCYENLSEGDINCFNGTERILFKGEEVYRLYYHGGKL